MAKHGSTRYVYPVRLGEVYLRVGALTWCMLPKTLKTKLELGTKKVSEIREAISNSAKVRSMPPVEVVGELWVVKDGPAHGRAVPLRIENLNVFGIQLPASSVTIEDESLIREIIVHEFAHVFYFLTKLLKARDERRSILLDHYDPENQYEDDIRMIKPEEWFGPEDVAAFVKQNDTQLISFENTFMEFHGQLPIVRIKTHFEAKGIVIPRDVTEHIRQLKE